MASPRRYNLAEAARACGYKRINTFRERHLATDEQRSLLDHDYDEQGRVIVDADAVDALADDLRAMRRARGNWRVRNLGPWAKPGADRPQKASK